MTGDRTATGFTKKKGVLRVSQDALEFLIYRQCSQKPQKTRIRKAIIAKSFVVEKQLSDLRPYLPLTSPPGNKPSFIR